MTKTVLAIGLSLAVVTIALLSCRHSSEARADHQQQDGEEMECLKWKNVVGSLSQEEKEKLLREGALRKEGVGLILSDSLINDCRLRNEMSAYILRVINGRSETKKEDRDFAAQYSPEIVTVLRRIWPSLSDSKALVGDGNFNSEKYNLLADPALRESDLAPLISDILNAETIDNNLAKILFSRPLLGTKQTLEHLQKDAEDENDVSWQIINLALLQKMGEPSALPKLKRLLQSGHLTTNERKTLMTLIAKAERGEEIKFSDIENLEYEN
jgi:hypothetical protein